MRMEMRFGNPVLIFLYSLALLLIGCAAGIWWHRSPSMAVSMALLGAVLMVIHDALTALLMFLGAAVWIRPDKKRATTEQRSKP